MNDTFVIAIWPSGYQCDKCGCTDLYTSPRRWATTCKNCGRYKSFESEKIRLIRKIPQATNICACVCAVYDISIRDILDNEPTKSVRYRRLRSRARDALKRELSELITKSEEMILFKKKGKHHG